MHRILELLENNSNLTPEDIAVMIDKTPEEVREAISQYEKEGVIVGKKTIINWQKADKDLVTAFIEVKCTPQYGRGFDQIAERFYQYEQVKSVYLMSGAYDLALIVEGNSLTEVASFVSGKLATMDTVISTCTHFVLKKYKDNGVMLETPPKDERQVMAF